ncbi:MAG: peptidase S53, partial [Bryobacteraceae bacterium]
QRLALIEEVTAWAADNRTFYLYGYSFALNPAKTVQSLVLPANGNVAVMAVTLTPALQVPLGSALTKVGIVSDGSTFSTGLDGYGYAYSASLLGSSLSAGGVTFSLGAANVPNAATSGTVPLPNAAFSAVKVLATGVSGSQKAQALTVRYADGSTSVFTQDFSDWFTPKSYAGESIALTMAYRDVGSGARDNRTFYVYSYSFTLNSGKAVSSITLPGNANVALLAITMVP